MSNQVALESNAFKECNHLSCLIFKGDTNIAKSVQLPVITNVFVPKTYRDKLFGGRPVIKLDLDNTQNICQQAESSIPMTYIIVGGLSLFGILYFVYFDNRKEILDQSVLIE